MKTIEEIQKENPDCEVMLIENFLGNYYRKTININSGVGYFHNGTRKVNLRICEFTLGMSEVCSRYPYVCWHES